MSCDRCPKATPWRIAQVSVRYSLLRSQTRRTVCPFCRPSDRHPLLPRMHSIHHVITLIDFSCSPPSPFVPPALGPPGPSPIPTPAITGTFFLPSPVAFTDSHPGTPRLLATSLDLAFLSRPTTPATQMWPSLPPARASFEPTPIRHGVSIAELVDEEGSPPGTRGGMSSSRPAATCATMSSAQSYPPLSISIVEITPRPIPEAPEVSEMNSPRSSPSFPFKPPGSSTTHVPGPSRSPLVSSTDNDRRGTTGKGGKTPRRLKPNRIPLVAHEVPERRVTRSSAKRKAAEDLGMGTEPPKRMKTSSP